MAKPVTVESGSEDVLLMAAWVTAAEAKEGAGLLTKGCVCCIFTVALGSGFFPDSGGIVIRAVSFFGAAPFGACSIAVPVAGLIGTIGFGAIAGGFGAGLSPLPIAPGGFIPESGVPPGGFGGGGMNGLAPEGG